MTGNREHEETLAARVDQPRRRSRGAGEVAEAPVGRRGALRAVLMGAAAGLGAAVLGGRHPDPASAGAPLQGSGTATAAGVEGDNTLGGPGVLGDITGSPPATWISAGVWGRSNGTAPAIEGDNTAGGGTGVLGTSTAGTGVSGSDSSTGAGVSGTSAGGKGVSGSDTAGGTGVSGTSAGGTGDGVVGTTDGGLGVSGTTAGGSAAAGVYGISTGTASAGVWGESFGSPGVTGSYGVYGDSDVGVGVAGLTTRGGTGVYGVDTGGGMGVFGEGAGGVGVYGLDITMGTGVQGVTAGSTTAGVEGDNTGSGPGVFGNNSGGGYGVHGTSQNGSDTASKVQNVGVYGQATGTAYGIGVLGYCSNDVNSVGLYGQSNTGKGFLGFSLSATGTGAVGVNTQGGTGLLGISQGGSGPGFGVISSGNCFVQGALTVTGAKSAAVRDASGALRRMYSMESPESWFEDFGTSQLSGGSATVQLEPGFAGVVKTDAYHVFLTPRGSSKWLYVSAQSAADFTVQEAEGGASDIAFSYRVVAKRKDIEGARLEHVAEPPPVTVPAPFEAPRVEGAPIRPPASGLPGRRAPHRAP